MIRLAFAPILAVALASTGCASPEQLARRLRAEDVRAIGPSRTTKAQLLALLGPPIAIAGAGEIVRAPSVQMRAETAPARLEPFRFDGSYPVQGDALLELFADDVVLTREHRVYEFRAHEEACSPSACAARARYLWVLVDEATELVVAVRPKVRGAPP